MSLSVKKVMVLGIRQVSLVFVPDKQVEIINGGKKKVTWKECYDARSTSVTYIEEKSVLLMMWISYTHN